MMDVLVWVLVGYSVLLSIWVWQQLRSLKLRVHLEVSKIGEALGRLTPPPPPSPTLDVVSIIQAVTSGLATQAQVLVPPPPEPAPFTPPPEEGSFVTPNYHFVPDIPDPTDDYLADSGDVYDNATRAALIEPGALPGILGLEDEINRSFGS